MAAMLTSLTEFSDNGNSRTSTTTGHVATKPKLVIQKRKVPTGNQTVLEDDVNVVHGAEDSDGVVLPQKVSFHVVCRRSVNAISTDVDAALAVFRDVVAGDEFGNMVSTQEWL